MSTCQIDILDALAYGPKSRAALARYLVVCCGSETRARALSDEIAGLVRAGLVIVDGNGLLRLNGATP